ncbi:MAG: response regulator [Marinilabiliaceae bacterium]|jgi:CheY-like chemotaxis protein|nr:response regulator [Marinilabiliaceae bacterium]
MGIQDAKNERKESFPGMILSGLKKGDRFLIFIIVSLFLLTASIVFISFGFFVPALICLVISIVLLLLALIYLFRREKERKRDIEELKGLIEDKDRYLSDFSHRIRTPLNNFSFIIDYLMDSKPANDQKEMLETLIASTTNMVEAVNDLTLQSAQELSFEPRKQIRFSLASALQNTIDIFSANTGGKVKFRIDNSGIVNDRYTGDPITLKQIFLDIFNSLLVENTDEINAVVSTGSAGKKGKKELVLIKVSADIMIPAFNPASYDDEKIGSMAVKLISKLNGEYTTTVSPALSELSFTLPFDLPPVEDIQSKAAERIKELKTVTSKEKKLADANVLLVEDNPTNQKIVEITLKSLVKSIDTATTGKEALDKFGKSTYDIILMDIQLPVMDGITAAGKIRELEKSTSLHTPIIAITANAMLGDKEKCLSAGMDEYLSKPFQPSELIRIIESFVTRGS